MKYAFFNTEGRVDSAHNDDTVTELPSGAVELSEAQFAERFDLLLAGGRLTVSPFIPVPTAAEIIANYVAAIQKRLDDFARTRNYDGILSAATYATSAVPKFKTEGQYAVTARDATWAKGYEILAAVEAGTRAAPTLDELAAELPALAWPQ